MPLSHVLTNLDDARDTLVNSINSRGGNLEESATLYQCAAAVNALASGVLSINGHLPDESGSVTIPDATQTTSGLMSAADKAKLDNVDAPIFRSPAERSPEKSSETESAWQTVLQPGFCRSMEGKEVPAPGGCFFLPTKHMPIFPGVFCFEPQTGRRRQI